MMPCSTSTVASGRSRRRCSKPAARADAAEQEGDGNDRQRIMPRDERHQDAGEAIARRERRVGAALNGGDLDHAGKPGGGTAEQAVTSRMRRPTGRPASRAARGVAADHARGKAEGRVVHQDIGEDTEHDAERQAPMHLHAGHVAERVGVGQRIASTAC